MDEPLVEVSTDKVDTEIPSPVAGTLLEITAGEDETVEVGGELAMIGDAGAAPAPAPEPQPEPKPEPKPAARTASRSPSPLPHPAPQPEPEPKPDRRAGTQARRPGRSAAGGPGRNREAAAVRHPGDPQARRRHGVDLAHGQGHRRRRPDPQQDVVAAAEAAKAAAEAASSTGPGAAAAAPARRRRRSQRAEADEARPR